MPVPNSISVDKLDRLVGTVGCPVVLDVRTDDAFRDDPRLIPGSLRRHVADIEHWSADLTGRDAVLVCRHGHGLSHGAAAYLRQAGFSAETLDGGFEAWEAAGLPLVPEAKLPPRDARARTVWVTRARPKVDRIACPWLIRRFVDPEARFLYVAPGEVLAVAAAERAEPFDVVGEGVMWTHRGERCSFDALVDGFGLAGHAPLARLAAIVRGADTDRLDLAPEAAGLLALSLGLSRLHDDDHAQLEAGLTLYDALYRWCRDAQGERHDARSHRPARDAVTA